MSYDFTGNFILLILFLIIIYFGYYITKYVYKSMKEKKYEKKLVTSNIKDIDKLDGLQFEVYLKALFKELGYKVKVTKETNDFGADLVMMKNNKKIVVQAKRYKYKSNVSVDAVQQIYTAIPYYKANVAWIITNSFYTKNAQKLANVCDVKLLNRYKLIDFISKVEPSVTPYKVKKAVPPKERKCPNCKSSLVIRHSKKGDDFFGCSNFPSCKHTESIAN